MAEEASKAGVVDFWGELEEAEQTVDDWPAWQQRYDADPNYEDTSKYPVK